MTTYVEDEDGNVISEECMLYCTPVHVAECDAPQCQCGCHDDAGRARELDDRPDETLHSIARDMVAERLPTLDELRRERHGDVRWLIAERWSA